LESGLDRYYLEYLENKQQYFLKPGTRYWGSFCYVTS